MTKKLVLASQNQGKAREYRALLAHLGVELLSLAEYAELELPPETGATFLENARIKARAVVEGTGLAALAEDSGLCVECLGGEPGVFSARFSGPEATDEDNCRLLLERLAGVPCSERGAYFEAAAVLMTPGGEEIVGRGRLHGFIAGARRGGGGFGYDPLFVAPEFGRTLAELPLEAKNRISHRFWAWRGLISDEKKFLRYIDS